MITGIWRFQLRICSDTHFCTYGENCYNYAETTRHHSIKFSRLGDHAPGMCGLLAINAGCTYALEQISRVSSATQKQEKKKVDINVCQQRVFEVQTNYLLTHSTDFIKT